MLYKYNYTRAWYCLLQEEKRIWRFINRIRTTKTIWGFYDLYNYYLFYP